MGKTTYNGTATWDGSKWWAVSIDDLPEGMIGVTQGRTREEAESMAREAVALLLDVDEDSIDVALKFQGTETADGRTGDG